MREEPRRAPARGDGLTVGGVAAQWGAGGLSVDVDAPSTPWRQRVVGTIAVDAPPTEVAAARRLHPTAPHWWQPAAPRARVTVAMERPRLRWSGPAYLDANWGQQPLACAFRRWHWQRLWHPGGTLVSYRTQLAGGGWHLTHALLDDAGGIAPTPAPAADLAPLPPSRWRLARQCCGRPVSLKALEDTPFYSRSRLRAVVDGRELGGIHEQLDLVRLQRRWVEFLLPFRMARRS